MPTRSVNEVSWVKKTTSSHSTSSFLRVGAGDIDNVMHVGGYQGAKGTAIEGTSSRLRTCVSYAFFIPFLLEPYVRRRIHSPSRTGSHRRPSSSCLSRSCNIRILPHPTASAPINVACMSRRHHPEPNRRAIRATPSSPPNPAPRPAQLRGFLAQFGTLLVTGAAYNWCMGCSETVACVRVVQRRRCIWKG